MNCYLVRLDSCGVLSWRLHRRLSCTACIDSTISKHLFTPVSTADFARLAPQTIRPADGYIRYPYLIPAGYYTQMWDWDGFFIGVHWANQDAADAKYLRDWVLGFAASADDDGIRCGMHYAGGSAAAVRQICDEAVSGAGRADCVARVCTIMNGCVRCGRRCSAFWNTGKRTQFDAKWGLWFWDNAMQSGADNNAALSNDPKDPSAILAVDASVYAMREYLAMAVLAEHLSDPTARKYREKAAATRRCNSEATLVGKGCDVLESAARQRRCDSRDRVDEFSAAG